MTPSTIPAALAGLVLLLAVPVPAAAQDPAALKAEGATLIKEYADTLGAALRGAIERDGPAGAIGVCHEAAPRIAADLGAKSGWTVRRTSLKARNPAAATSPYEHAVLEDFQARLTRGEDIATLTRAETVEEDGRKVFHLVKAIPTGELCLTCHGDALRPEVKAKLDELYPGDAATGFKAGDMRGAFSFSKRL
ncbi:MAG TPA: DUF3365 domain-containing protein [Azospirillum sp.]|nr:DUF3365 domain-containing protein [Azospirillum sp.]